VNKHQRTIQAISEKQANIAWPDIESLLVHLGAEVSEGRGSRMRVALRGAVAAVRRVLIEAGIDDV